MTVYSGSDAIEQINLLVDETIVVKITDDVSIELIPPTISAVKGLQSIAAQLGDGTNNMDVLLISAELATVAYQICIPGLTSQQALGLYRKCGGIKSDLTYHCLNLCGLEMYAEALSKTKEEVDDEPNPKTSSLPAQ